MEGKLDSYLVSRIMRTIAKVYTAKRKSIREHNTSLKKEKLKKKVPVSEIKKLILRGETENEALAKEMKSNEVVKEAVHLCTDFKKIIKGGLKITLDEWIKKG